MCVCAYEGLPRARCGASRVAARVTGCPRTSPRTHARAVVDLAFSYPLAIAPAREIIEKSMLTNDTPGLEWKRNVIRTVIVALTCEWRQCARGEGARAVSTRGSRLVIRAPPFAPRHRPPRIAVLIAFFPSFGVIVNIVGGISVSALSFILPCLMLIQVCV